MGIRGALYLALTAVSVAFSGYWGRRLLAAGRRAAETNDPADQFGVPSATQMVIGLVTNFLDTLGIGSFAPTTSAFKLLQIVPDRLIPGTLLAGHSIPTLAQAFIYITIIDVDMRTLVLLVAAAVLGAWLGAGMVSGWPRRAIRVGMGMALLVAAAIFLATALDLLPSGGEAISLHGARMAIGLVGNFLLGALMTIGIGAYAPSLILFGLLGMNLKSVFPVMMGSCAFLMPISGMRFVQSGSYAPRAALGLSLGGIPGVFLAAFLVREMSVDAVRWLVIAVALYAAVAMLRSAKEAGG